MTTRRNMVTMTLLLTLALCLAGPHPADAGDTIVSEVRGGVYAHDISFWSFHRENGADINGEVLFVSPSFLEAVWSPRPHLGATVNTSGNTSFLYSGLTWEYDLPADFFVDANLGLAAHNGKLDTDNHKRKSLGSPVLFRLGAALGYNITEKVNISIQFEHMSNAYIVSPNEGMDNVGLRLGYRF
ncbi:acyloxyacyl hydrolase [Pseudodesulfovibrio pelocollis]|uniref:acyloxyacyl hydrolase n=1 Tax=Pseudodesulfovibrio pelocollis TaxID=3051432 RepID=UPI00255B402C|nr:acyloxyacyl hydrolase [Pseudodesulfovibrio sp. SB368]